MAMATPVYEAIMQALATRIAGCTTTNGFSFSVAEVVRRKRGETPQYLAGTVELWTGDITDLAGSSQQGTAWREYQMTAEVAVFVDAPDGASSAADTIVANAVAEVHRAIGIDDRLDICNTAFLSSVSNFGADPGQAAGALITYTFTFDANETNITQGRSA